MNDTTETAAAAAAAVKPAAVKPARKPAAVKPAAVALDLSKLSPALRARIERETASADPSACRARIVSALRTLADAMSKGEPLAALALAGKLPGLYAESLTARRSSGETLTRGRKLGR